MKRPSLRLIQNVLLVVLVLLTTAEIASGRPPAPPAVAEALAQAWPNDRATAECVAWHESRYDLEAVSPTGDYGLMQINRQAHSSWVVFQFRPAVWPIFRLDYNVRVAKRIYLSALRQGRNPWSPWAAYRYCR